jgi:ribosomal protein S18 acetylase RimI-like enzyme
MAPAHDRHPEARFAWRGEVSDEELARLTEAAGGARGRGWWDRVRPHSLGWVVARTAGSTLIGFVNVAWDGGDHAFLLDAMVRPDHRRRGIGTELVRTAARHAQKAGCEWLEVDFEPHLVSFYYDACGFRPTSAGLLHLPGMRGDGGS